MALLSPDERRVARAAPAPAPAPAPVQLSVIKKLSVQPRDSNGISIQQPPAAAKSSPPPAETPPPGPDTGEAEAEGGGQDIGGKLVSPYSYSSFLSEVYSITLRKIKYKVEL